ncbi:MAG: hypothetical protein R3E08_01255 [Thiotrichaceae bacterium]
MGHVAEAFLHHNRPSSVLPMIWQVFKKPFYKPRIPCVSVVIMHRWRELSQAVAHPILAVGAHLKNTVAL